MEYKKIINLLDDKTSRPSKFRTKKWVEVNDESREAYNNVDNENNNNNNIKLKTLLIRSNLCNYSDACILVKGAMSVPNTAAQEASVNNINKKVILM